MKLKILFLDLDGVLNVIPEGHDKFGAIFHKHFVDNLRKIVEVSGCKIVVSSSWRISGLDFIQEMWKFRDYPGEVIDVTPSLRLIKGGSIRFFNDKLERHPTESVGGYSIPRGCEIEYWLQHEAERFGEVESFAIADDDTDFLMSQYQHFIQCSGNDHEDCVDIGYGLTNICTDKIIKILNDVK